MGLQYRVACWRNLWNRSTVAINMMLHGYLLCLIYASSVVVSASTLREKDEHVRNEGKRGFLAALSAASAAVSAGATAQSVYDSSQKESVTFTIENLTKWRVDTHGIECRFGAYDSPPPSINPGKRETFFVHSSNSLFEFHGTMGVVRWEIRTGSGKIPIAVMWHVPYRLGHLHHDAGNELGIGIPKKWSQATWRTMWDHKNGSKTWFNKAQFRKNSQKLEKCNKIVCIEGLMGSDSTTTIKLSIVPKEEKNLFTAI